MYKFEKKNLQFSCTRYHDIYKDCKLKSTMARNNSNGMFLAYNLPWCFVGIKDLSVNQLSNVTQDTGLKRKKRKLNPGFEMSSRSNLHREMNIFLKKINGMFFSLIQSQKTSFVYVIVIKKNSAKFEPDDYLTDKISC